jgi:hypothetical protein
MILEIPPACLDAASYNSQISKFGSLEPSCGSFADLEPEMGSQSRIGTVSGSASTLVAGITTGSAREQAVSCFSSSSREGMRGEPFTLESTRPFPY